MQQAEDVESGNPLAQWLHNMAQFLALIACYGSFECLWGA